MNQSFLTHFGALPPPSPFPGVRLSRSISPAAAGFGGREKIGTGEGAGSSDGCHLAEVSTSPRVLLALAALLGCHYLDPAC